MSEQQDTEAFIDKAQRSMRLLSALTGVTRALAACKEDEEVLFVTFRSISIDFKSAMEQLRGAGAPTEMIESLQCVLLRTSDLLNTAVKISEQTTKARENLEAAARVLLTGVEPVPPRKAV